jgi:hypothetical protein
LEEAGAVVEEEAGTTGVVGREAACGWDEKSIAQRR